MAINVTTVTLPVSRHSTQGERNAIWRRLLCIAPPVGASLRPTGKSSDVRFSSSRKKKQNRSGGVVPMIHQPKMAVPLQGPRLDGINVSPTRGESYETRVGLLDIRE